MTCCPSEAAGWDHKLAVKTSGSLVAIGWNLYGQVQGLAGQAESETVYIHTWTPLSINVGRDRVVTVAAGEKHRSASPVPQSPYHERVKCCLTNACTAAYCSRRVAQFGHGGIMLKASLVLGN